MTARNTERADVPRHRFDNAIEHGAPHMRPLWLAARDAGCAVAIITQGHQRFDLPLDHPTIAIIGDDLHESRGPAGFHRKSLRRLFGQARGVSIVACEPLLMAYAAQAATSAGLRAHTLIIETRPRHEGDWQRFVEEHAPDAAVLIATVKPDGDVN